MSEFRHSGSKAAERTMDKIVRPNVFIVGAMKCGTTILSDYLAEHPAIAIARGKEVHYFTLNIDKGEEWYLDHFRCDERTRIAVDASPTYFDTCNTVLVPKLIKSFNPDAKVIILIRDPVERAVSHFNHMVKIDKAPELASTTLSDLLSKDILTTMLGADIRATRVGFIIDFSAYYKKILNYVHVFGRDRVLLLHNEDLRRNGARVMRRVFEFLDLEPVESVEFSKQKYLHGTSRETIDLRKELDLYRLYSADYIASCRYAGVQRFREDCVQSFDDPAGAISGDVAFGREGWLFLVQGTNNVLDFFTGGVPTNDLVEGWIGRVRERCRRLTEIKCDFMQVFIPEKISIYHDKLPWRIDPNMSPGRVFSKAAPSNIAGKIIDLFGVFEAGKAKYPLYYKTDSHWTHYGAFLAYQMICHRLDIEFDPTLLNRPSQTGEIVLDLGAKISPSVKEKATFFNFIENAELIEEGDLVRYKNAMGRPNDSGLHVGSTMRYACKKPRSQLRVMLFGDSFSEYRNHLLTGLLAETFAEFMFVWSTSLDFTLIDNFRPDLVISAMTERFMTRVPDDTFDIITYVQSVLKREKAA